jgi:hypothetical protein
MSRQTNHARRGNNSRACLHVSTKGTKYRGPGLEQLGRLTRIPISPETALLDWIPNPHPDSNYLARFTAPEFTSLCPKTGQPDFAHLVVEYAPAKRLVESKIPQIVFLQLSQPWGFSRGLHCSYWEEARYSSAPEVAAHRGILVSTGRNAD